MFSSLALDIVKNKVFGRSSRVWYGRTDQALEYTRNFRAFTGLSPRLRANFQKARNHCKKQGFPADDEVDTTSSVHRDYESSWKDDVFADGRHHMLEANSREIKKHCKTCFFDELNNSYTLGYT